MYRWLHRLYKFCYGKWGNKENVIIIVGISKMIMAMVYGIGREAEAANHRKHHIYLESRERNQVWHRHSSILPCKKNIK